MNESSELAPSLGAITSPEGVQFTVWAPASDGVDLLLEDSSAAMPLERQANGLHTLFVPGLGAGERYRYRLGEDLFPDPASRFQPQGVHGPSEVVDPRSYRWRNSRPEAGATPGPIYELHVGTFSPEGTFAGTCERLPYLAELGVEIIELMPVADFPGRWNWGYDPGAFFAPSRAYGTPDDLRCLVDDAHGLGLRVVLDVVYNHFGPAGAYWPVFDPHTFTSRHRTPWGDSIDFDGPHSAGLRRMVLENALMWLSDYRFDGLRLDATFAIIDDGPCHLLAELSSAVAALPGPGRLLIAEDPRNSRNVLLPQERSGLGMGAVWADDFHHQLRVRLAGDDSSYYRDYTGSSAQIAETLEQNWFYRGHHSIHHGRPRGTPAADLAADRFVVCIQNHDQVGNRADGARLHHEIPLHAYRAASALLLFAPQTPLLFMGQEWAATTPFLFFTDHDGELGEQVSEGRRQEFADFGFGEEVPDPQDPETFHRSRLPWQELEQERHATTSRFYRALLKLRRSLSGPVQVEEQADGLAVRRGIHLLLVALDGGAQFALPEGAITLVDSEDPAYSPDPRPPVISGRAVTFERPAALLMELRR